MEGSGYNKVNTTLYKTDISTRCLFLAKLTSQDKPCTTRLDAGYAGQRPRCPGNTQNRGAEASRCSDHPTCRANRPTFCFARHEQSQSPPLSPLARHQHRRCKKRHKGPLQDVAAKTGSVYEARVPKLDPPASPAHVRTPLTPFRPCRIAVVRRAGRPGLGGWSSPPSRQGCARSRPRRRMLGSKSGSAFEEDWATYRLQKKKNPQNAGFDNGWGQGGGGGFS